MALHAEHPLLAFELLVGNELANLSRRNADIAVRANRRPPQHLVGKHLGPIRVAVFAAKRGSVRRYADVEAGKAAWIAPDDALPDHPSVVWRKRRFPKVVPTYRVDSILTVMELVGLGLGRPAADVPGRGASRPEAAHRGRRRGANRVVDPGPPGVAPPATRLDGLRPPVEDAVIAGETAEIRVGHQNIRSLEASDRAGTACLVSRARPGAAVSSHFRAPSARA